jgi:hypothetical protein
VIPRPRIDEVIPSSFVVGHSAVFHLVGKFQDFPMGISVIMGASSGYCRMLNYTVFLCKIGSVFADSHRVSLFISLVGLNSILFDTSMTFEIAEDSRKFGHLLLIAVTT